MSSLAELLGRVESSKMSPLLLCNLLARRARQLANGQGGALFSELISVAVTEFLEGRLRYEVNGQRLQSACDAQAAGALENEKTHNPKREWGEFERAVGSVRIDCTRTKPL